MRLQTEFIARIIKEVYERELSSIVVKAEVIEEYNRYIQDRVSNSIWYSPECGSSWYKDGKSSKVTVPAPFGASESLSLLRSRFIKLTDSLCRSLPFPLAELWARTRKIRFEDWTFRRLTLPHPSGKPILTTVHVETPWNRSPFGALMDWIAERRRQTFENAMVKK